MNNDAEAESERTRIRKLLVRNFPGAPALTAAEITNINTQYHDHEGNLVARFLDGLPWSAVDDYHLNVAYPGDRSAVLGFMTPRGFSYFLPAFLAMALDFPANEDVASSLSHGIVARANRPGDLFSPPYNPSQLATLFVALEYLRSQYAQFEFPDNPASEAIAVLSSRYGMGAK